ncbi:hypothetical protein [Streptodolium elevatio]|uniref:Uncharacterized protein n=1 Tax=Streptodolium elevatio TaxID=3157996 RepID=A0ABV3DQ38_9ACTN
MPDIARETTGETGAGAAAGVRADESTAPVDAPDARLEDPDEVPAPDDLDLEAPEADVAEQRTEVVDEDERVWEPVPDGVDPADGTDQRRVAGPDEDEYR